MMAIKLLSAVHGQRGVIRNYQHDEFGVLPIVIVWGGPGNADVINLTPVAQFIRARNAKREGRDMYTLPHELQVSTRPSPKKRRPRQRHTPGGDLPPAA
jgi:hypothetical protein